MDAGDKKRVLILGGGAGGIELAVRLARHARRLARVTLVDRDPTHIWKPRLHEIATGLLRPDEEAVSYAEQAQLHGFGFVLGEIRALDPERRHVTVGAVSYPVERLAHAEGDGAMLPERTLDYDYAVLAIGSTINEFGTPGVREHCFSLDTTTEADRLHCALMALAMRVRAGEAERASVAIVGAGTTGVELAAELDAAARDEGGYGGLVTRDRLRIMLIEAADKPLASASSDTSDYARAMLERHGIEMHFDAKVAKVEARRLLLEDGRAIDADLLVWASGVRGHAFADTIPNIIADKQKRVLCDAMLRTRRASGGVSETLFAIGDAAACFEEGSDKPTPATAQAAHQQARHLARSMAAMLRGGRLRPFRFHYRGTLVSLGSGKAVGDLPTWRTPVRISGLSAKLAYVALYRGHLASLYGLGRTAALTLADLLRRTATPKVKLHW